MPEILNKSSLKRVYCRPGEGEPLYDHDLQEVEEVPQQHHVHGALQVHRRRQPGPNSNSGR